MVLCLLHSEPGGVSKLSSGTFLQDHWWWPCLWSDVLEWNWAAAIPPSPPQNTVRRRPSSRGLSPGLGIDGGRRSKRSSWCYQPSPSMFSESRGHWGRLAWNFSDWNLGKMENVAWRKPFVKRCLKSSSRNQSVYKTIFVHGPIQRLAILQTWLMIDQGCHWWLPLIWNQWSFPQMCHQIPASHYLEMAFFWFKQSSPGWRLCFNSWSVSLAMVWKLEQCCLALTSLLTILTLP